MPIQYEVARTPGGHAIYRTESTGEVTQANAQEYREKVLGAARGELPLLTVTRRGVEMSAAARKELSSISADKDDPRPAAFVVESAPMRVTMSFIFKVIGYEPKLFATEPEALRYLDEQLTAR